MDLAPKAPQMANYYSSGRQLHLQESRGGCEERPGAKRNPRPKPLGVQYQL